MRCLKRETFDTEGCCSEHGLAEGTAAHLWKRPFAGFKGLGPWSWSKVILQQMNRSEASVAARNAAKTVKCKDSLYFHSQGRGGADVVCTSTKHSKGRTSSRDAMIVYPMWLGVLRLLAHVPGDLWQVTYILAHSAGFQSLQDLVPFRRQGPQLSFTMRIVAALAKRTPPFLPSAQADASAVTPSWSVPGTR